MNKTISVLQWTFGIVFAIVGVAMLFSKVAVGILFLLAALMLLPPVARTAKEKFGFAVSWKIRFAAIAVLIIAIGILNPAPHKEPLRQQAAATSTAARPQQPAEAPTRPPLIASPSTTPVYAGISGKNDKAGNDIVSVGSNAILRIPHNTDPESVVLLSPDPNTYNDEMNKLYAVKGNPEALYYQMGALAAKGWIGVSNGTKIVVIDKKGILDPLYEVRIMNGVRDVDSDKIGLSGWSARTFISKD